jgi:hypothetical protein
MSAQTEHTPLVYDDAELPQEAAMVLTALEAAGGRENRRQCVRSVYRATAMLALFADSPDLPARIIYSRDVNERGIGFVTRERLPLGYGGILSLPGPHTRGQVFNIPCTLYRCRLAAPGWYEGALHFNRDQTAFRAQELVGDQEDITDLFDTDADPHE